MALFELVSGVSSGEVSKAAVAVFFQQHLHDRDPSSSWEKALRCDNPGLKHEAPGIFRFGGVE